jgi:hypothetical protein
VAGGGVVPNNVAKVRVAGSNPDLLTCGEVLPGQDNGPGHGRATIVARRFDFCRPPWRDDLGRLAGNASYGSHSFCGVRRSGIPSSAPKKVQVTAVRGAEIGPSWRVQGRRAPHLHHI